MAKQTKTTNPIENVEKAEELIEKPLNSTPIDPAGTVRLKFIVDTQHVKKDSIVYPVSGVDAIDMVKQGLAIVVEDGTH